MADRIAKIMSACGVSSRREAERMISAGRITVNGVQAALGDCADMEADDIQIDGKPLRAPDERVYIALNKPCGYITTASDHRGRKTVIDLVSDLGVRVYPVGRLDMDSEGLILLTNDGAFAQTVMHPSNEKEKVYEVRVTGDVKQALPQLSAPMDIDGYTIRPAQAKVLRTEKNGGTLEIRIHEGRNRQVRKMCRQTGLTVVSLKRTEIGGVKLGGLAAGKWRHLSESEIGSFLKSD